MPAASRLSTVIGIPKEIKHHENRVSLTPSGAQEFRSRGHRVVVEKGAGLNSGFRDNLYTEIGCEVVDSAAEVFAEANFIMKVKEPQPSEFNLIRKNHTVFTFFHFAADEGLTRAMIDSGAVCIAYETIEKDGRLPLLMPMSEVAGKMAVQEGAKYLEKAMGGLGILLGGVAGVKPARVLVIGGGVVGACAAKVAAGMGADVVVLEVSLARIRELEQEMPKNVKSLYSSEQTLEEELAVSDLVIGAVLIPGARAPHVVKKKHLARMKKGAVIVDVAVDQGGCVQTCAATTHDNPTFVVDGIVHYCVVNMPGTVPFTSTVALSNATLRYALSLAADQGLKGACEKFPELVKGVNIAHGKVLCKGVADEFNLPLQSMNDLCF